MKEIITSEKIRIDAVLAVSCIAFTIGLFVQIKQNQQLRQELVNAISSLISLQAKTAAKNSRYADQLDESRIGTARSGNPQNLPLISTG